MKAEYYKNAKHHVKGWCMGNSRRKNDGQNNFKWYWLYGADKRT